METKKPFESIIIIEIDDDDIEDENEEINILSEYFNDYKL